MTMTAFNRIIRAGAGMMLLLLAACGQIAPPTTPAQLAHTPGPYVTVTEDLYDAGVFRLDYPDGWRVVTSAASAPLSVVFVSPAENALMTFSVEPFETLPEPSESAPFERETRRLSLNDETPIYAALVHPADDAETFTTLFEHVLTTLESSPTSGG